MKTAINKISSERSKEIAGIILMQLGGNRFMMMTGSKPQYCDQYTSCYKLTRNKCGAQYMKITLNAMDLYNVEFIRIKRNNGEIVVLESRIDVYADALQELFTQITGLYTSLGTVGR